MDLVQYKVLHMTFELTRIHMSSYFSPGHKTSRNWSKPRKWCAFLFNVKNVYTARWRLFATPDYLGILSTYYNIKLGLFGQ